MDRRIINNDHRFPGDRLAKGIETDHNRFGIHTTLNAERQEGIVCVEKSKDIKAFAPGDRDLNRLPHKLPGIRNAGIKREASLIKIVERKIAGFMFFLMLRSLVWLG